MGTFVLVMMMVVVMTVMVMVMREEGGLLTAHQHSNFIGLILIHQRAIRGPCLDTYIISVNGQVKVKCYCRG